MEGPPVSKTVPDLRDRVFARALPQGGAPVQFKHSWTNRQRCGLDSTCLGCSKVIATNTDELSLLSLERAHVCR
jgi:hypothetical protein